jgi:hypothetical protein
VAGLPCSVDASVNETITFRPDRRAKALGVSVTLRYKVLFGEKSDAIEKIPAVRLDTDHRHVVRDRGDGCGYAEGGAYKGTYSGVGTFKVNALDKDRVLVTLEETGLNMTDGFLDHMTWHCWGNGDYVKGMGVDQGHCIATDLSGDKLIAKFVSEKHTADQKNFIVTVTCDGGTGKYAGAACTETDTMRGNEFPPAPEGTYVTYVTF